MTAIIYAFVQLTPEHMEALLDPDDADGDVLEQARERMQTELDGCRDLELQLRVSEWEAAAKFPPEPEP